MWLGDFREVYDDAFLVVFDIESLKMFTEMKVPFNHYGGYEVVQVDTIPEELNDKEVKLITAGVECGYTIFYIDLE